MKTKYPSIFGLLAILMLVVSLLPMAKLEEAQASPGMLYWDKVATPTYYPTAGWILKSPSNVDQIAIGSDGSTFYALDIGACQYTAQTGGKQVLYKSTNAGITWSDKIGVNLYNAMAAYSPSQLQANQMYIWDVVVAPDDPNFVAVVTLTNDASWEPHNVWISTNGGTSWMNTNAGIAVGLWIEAIAISPSYAGALGTTHDIAIGIKNPTGAVANLVLMVSYPIGVGVWGNQGFTGGDVFAMMFSPSYAGDFCLVVVSATIANTFVNVGFHETITNTTVWNTAIGAHFTAYPVEVAAVTGTSPNDSQIVSADLDLVSDWNGDDPRSRKYFVSYDAYTVAADVYRLDDTIVYDLNVPAPLIDTDGPGVAVATKHIASISYYGTSTAGKLLAGERLANQCSATVMSWISLDPLACPAPCWTPSAKPQTGGAGTDCEYKPTGAIALFTFGNMMVVWAPDGTKAYAGTSNAEIRWAETTTFYDDFETPWNEMPKDESAFCVTRNDNLTWNQLSLIDTWVAKFTDVAPAMDCSVLFAASINANDNSSMKEWWYAENCSGFDSVWRTPNFDKKGTALGSTWERVLCKATTPKACGEEQSNYAILRLAPDKTDGSVVFWAAGGNDDATMQVCWGGTNVTVPTPNTKAVMWSEDSGDLWYPIRPNLEVQDFAAESSTVIYVLDIDGKVQKITYARPNWKVSVYVDTCIGSGKSIAALAEGHVLVGPQEANGWVAYSADSGATWGTPAVPTPTTGKIHVAFDAKFIDNKTFYAADEGGSSVYRWVWGTSAEWTDMMTAAQKAGKAFHGLAVATEGTLYAAFVKAVSGVAAASEPVQAVVTTALTDGGDGLPESMRLTYTDQDGNASSVAFQIPLNAPAGTIIPITLAAGDTGVQDVADTGGVAEITSDATAGVINIRGTTTFMSFGTYNYAGAGLWTDGSEYTAGAATIASGVDRTLEPTRGIPKPGIEWSTLDDALASGVAFSLEPGSLKICGCLTADTNSTLYAIDDHPYACWMPLNEPYYGYTNTDALTAPAPQTDVGKLWMYTDCLAKKGPVTSGPDLVGCDPVSGRNQEINLAWEQLCLATTYQICIAKDAGLTQVVYWNPAYTPPWTLSPAFIYPAGGFPGETQLECGHTYYWAVRTIGHAVGDDAVLSPWSALKAGAWNPDSFQIKAGLPVTTPYIGPMLLSPANAAVGVPIKNTTFTWTTFKNTSEYHFQLSSTPDMLTILADVHVPTTAYTYDGTLEYSTNYYWQVRASKPAPSDWSPVFSFLTEEAPPPPPPPPAPPAPPPPTPMWVWAIIAIGALLVIVTLILIVRTRRV